MRVKAGFLIVKTFAKLYRDHLRRYNHGLNVYALPTQDKTPEEQQIQYRGLDRDALCPLEPKHTRDYKVTDYLIAQVKLGELEEAGKSLDGLVLKQQDATDVYQWLTYELGDVTHDYEMIWTRIAESGITIPSGFRSIGFEASYFISDHFSPSCDCMMFPRWHGTDQEGQLFLPYFFKLNRYGLFETPGVARDFLAHYLSFDWTEQDTDGDYHIVEVFIQEAVRL